MALLEVQALTFFHERRPLVEALEFTLEPGRPTALMGANGAGKTTALRLLAGVLHPSRGHIRIDGLDLARAPLAAKARIGFQPDPPPLLDDLGVGEYLEHCARLRGLDTRRSRQACDRVLEDCGLGPLRRRLVGRLSQGMRRRLGIAQALLHDPDLLLLDEPTAGLDPAQVMEIRELIVRLGHDRGLLLSTHLLYEVERLCERVLVLRDGHLIHDGPVRTAHGRTYRVGLQHPIEETALGSLPGVAEVERLHTDSFRVHLAEDGDPARLAEALVAQGWGLREFSPVDRGLEARLLDWIS